MILKLLQIMAIFSTALGGIQFKFADYNLVPERLIFFFVIPIILIKLMIKVPKDYPTIFYAFWIFISLLSLTISISPLEHLNGFAIYLVPFIFYLLFRTSPPEQSFLRNTIEIMLWIISVGSIGTYFAWLATGMYSDAIDYGRIKFTMDEANVFASTVGAFSVLHMGCSRMSIRTILLHGLCAFSIVLAQSKAPFVAYVVGVVFLMLRSRFLVRPSGFTAAVVSASVAIAAFIFYSNRLQNLYVDKLNRPDAINARLSILEVAWSRFTEYPIIGRGPLDFSLASPTLLMKIGSDDPRNLWIWQMFMAILHDTGAIGLITYCVLLLMVFSHSNKMYNRGLRQYAGYTAAFLVLLVASQSTTVHLSAIFGLIMGLAASPPTTALRKSRP